MIVGHRPDCFAPPQLHAATRLMKKSADTPMDFADATLDERGCRTYRFRSTRRFQLVLPKL